MPRPAKRRISRRRVLQLAAASTSLALPALALGAPVSEAITGKEVAELAAFDRWMTGFLEEHAIPGGQLAIAYRGRVVYSRGFGWADRTARAPVEPDSLFRIASVSKPITAVAVLRLVQQGKLRLEDRLVDVLPIEPHLEADAALDERWRQITIAHLLTHTGGWDREKSYDPMFACQRVAKVLGRKLPIGAADIIRYMRGQPLDFAPGERYAYSNFGYSLLGRVIEECGGAPYEKFVQQEVFAPLGIRAPQIGGSLASERAAKEVRYYTVNDVQAMPVVGPHAGDENKRVPLAYGGWNHRALDAHGGWIASCEDLVRFAAAFDTDERVPSPVLSTELVRQMFSPHARMGEGLAYGYGWLVWQPKPGRLPLLTHSGALACTGAVILKLQGDLNLAALFNCGQTPKGAFVVSGVDQKLAELAAGIRDWP